MSVNYKINWITASEIQNEHTMLLVTQVYGWLYSNDKKLAVVSKDNKNWQFPGGKPNKEESYLQTLNREMLEEVSLDISEDADIPRFFGYNHVQACDGDNLIDEFLQLRYVVKLYKASKELAIEPNENEDQAEGDIIITSEWATVDEVKKRIPWIADSKELQTFTDLVD